MSNQRTGRPDTSKAEPFGDVIKPPEARLDNSVIGRPAPVIDPSQVQRVEKPQRATAPEEKEHTWHRVQIDLGPSTDHIRINDQTFHQGHTYTVRDDLVPVLMETMFNTKMHEAVVKGQASPVGRRLQAGGRF